MDTGWTSLSRRAAGLGPEGPFDGLPKHLHSSVAGWFESVAKEEGDYDVERMARVALALRVNVGGGPPLGVEMFIALLFWGRSEEEKFLELMDAVLAFWGPDRNDWRILKATLRGGGSAWTISDDKTSLVRVVGDEQQAAYEEATAPQDDASAELRQAWAKAYGLHPDPSDAWDHAIKALECVLIPLVCPRKTPATMSDVIGTLSSAQKLWRSRLPGKDLTSDVAPLAEVLRLIWPNPDRHGGLAGSGRPPELEEARAVVSLTTTLVQWSRDSWIVAKR